MFIGIIVGFIAWKQRVFEGVRDDRPHMIPLSPVYEKVNQKNNYIKFIDKINIFTINNM